MLVRWSSIYSTNGYESVWKSSLSLCYIQDNDKGYDDVTVGERQQHTADHPTLPELADGELPKDIPSGGVTFDPNVSISYEEEPQVHEQTTPHADRLALDENDHDDVLLPDDIRFVD